MPGSIRAMQLEQVLRNVQTDRGSLLHGCLLRWQFDTVTLAHRCRRGASTPSPVREIGLGEGLRIMRRERDGLRHRGEMLQGLRQPRFATFRPYRVAPPPVSLFKVR